MGVAVKPGASESTTNSDRIARPVASSVAVLATTRTAPASSKPEMKYLVPLMTHSSPSRRAVVEIRWEFEPASGSVMAKAIFSSPEASRGNHRERCWSVP